MDDKNLEYSCQESHPLHRSDSDNGSYHKEVVLESKVRLRFINFFFLRRDPLDSKASFFVFFRVVCKSPGV